MDFLKTLTSKKATTWWLKQSQSNDKLLWKALSSSYPIDQKTFTEASWTNNIHAEEKVKPCHFLKVCGSFLFRQSKKNVWQTLVCLSLPSIFRGKKTKQILLARGKFGFLYVSICFGVTNFKFILTNSSLKYSLCSRQVLWYTQKQTLVYNFVACLKYFWIWDNCTRKSSFYVETFEHFICAIVSYF